MLRQIVSLGLIEPVGGTFDQIMIVCKIIPHLCQRQAACASERQVYSVDYIDKHSPNTFRRVVGFLILVANDIGVLQ